MPPPGDSILHQDSLDVRVLAKFFERFQGFLNVIDHAPHFDHPNAVGAGKKLEIGGHQPHQKADDNQQKDAEQKQEKPSHKHIQKLITRSYAQSA